MVLSVIARRIVGPSGRCEAYDVQCLIYVLALGLTSVRTAPGRAAKALREHQAVDRRHTDYIHRHFLAQFKYILFYSQAKRSAF